MVPLCLIEPSSSVPNTADTASGRLILPENVDTPATVRLPIPTSPLTSNEVSVPTFVSEELTTPEPRVVAFSTDVLLILAGHINLISLITQTLVIH